MDEQEARQVLGLNDDQQWSEQFLELAAARDHIAILVRRAPNETIAARYQDELMSFDRAMAWFRERESSMREKLIHEQPQLEPTPSTEAQSESPTHTEKKRHYGAFFVVLALICGGVFYGIHEWQKRQKMVNDRQLAAWESEAVNFLKQRRWDDAAALYEQMEKNGAASSAILLGRRSIEHGMKEEQWQYIAYLEGEAISHAEAGRWAEAEETIKKVLEEQPRHPKMLELADSLSVKKNASRRNELLNDARKDLRADDWDECENKLTMILQFDPEDTEAKSILKQVTAAREKETAAYKKAMELRDQIIAKDRGVYDASLLELIREARNLAPNDTEITKLYEKISAYGRTIRIPQDESSLADALKNAQTNDRIILSAGTYRGSHSVHVPIRIEAADKNVTLVSDATKGPVLHISSSANGTSLHALNMRHENFDWDEERYSILLVDGAKVNLTRCIVKDAAGHGIAVMNGGHATLNHCKVTSSGWDGLSIFGTDSFAHVIDCDFLENHHHGIDVWKNASAHIENTRSESNSSNGLLADDVAQLTVKGCSFRKNLEYGISLRLVVEAELSENTCAENALGGIVIGAGARAAVVKGNILEANQGPGILLDSTLDQPDYENNRWNNSSKGKILKASAE